MRRETSTHARRVFSRARRYLRLVLLRNVVELLDHLRVVAARLADRFDLAEDLDGALLDHFVGDFLVAEDHQFADGALAGAQLIAHDQDALGDGGRARDRLDHRELAALDALGNRDFAFAREQRDGAHLAQIHADRVVGLVERAWSEIQFRLVARSVTIEVLVAAVRFVGIDDLDARGAKGIEEVVELFRRGDFRRQNLVDLVVEQVPLLLADSDQLAYFVVFLFNRQDQSSDITRACMSRPNSPLRASNASSSPPVAAPLVCSCAIARCTAALSLS